MIPLNIRFDGAANVQGSNIVRMPKLSQGAPYSFGLRIRLEDESYREWDGVAGIRWRLKLAPADTMDLMILTLANGNFVIEEDDTLKFIVKASDWAQVKLPQSANHMEMDVPFSFVVEFLAAPEGEETEGVVVERFAQGSGLISVNLSA